MTRYDLEGPWTGAVLREAKRAFPFRSWAVVAVVLSIVAGFALAMVVKWPN